MLTFYLKIIEMGGGVLGGVVMGGKRCWYRGWNLFLDWILPAILAFPGLGSFLGLG